ncbi:YTH domain-containing family protein like [Actinidia chinensis var. chinensis]|uniref:YTH domain-containing family protein n=1 Tax=Actinidia chinensis var. chinensis TaxID=1590841 RepID=A0A2R6Q1M1_ACTCC|nr:YTH domain-containing family protein like [Actinidia chinensis var. chinensis]
MAGEKKIETSDSVAAVLNSEPFTRLVGQDVASGSGTLSILNSSISSSGDASSGIKSETGQESVAEQGVYYPTTSCYDYCYPGYNGNFSQLNHQNHFKAGDGSVLYYMPGYDPFATGPFMGVDGQQPYYSSPGYLQHPVSYGSEAMPCYTWNSACVGDVANGTAGFPGKLKSAHGSNTLTKSNGFNSIKSSGTPASKFSTLPSDSKSRMSAASTNVSKSILESQPFKTGGKSRSGYQSAGLDKGFHSVGKFSSYIDPNQGLLMHNSPMSYRSNGRVWNGNNKCKSRDKHGEFDTSTELTRGPRAQNGTNPSNPSEEEQLGPTVRRELYNLEEFQTEYDNAKFFVIKSYSEDDIHKCVSYDVWSSTPNGNKKLDAAFRDAETKASETGTKCPVFLFFSVNGSGQFVGVAEMIGPVDFNKDMGFWQLDKWNGVFPVKWHVLKDTPNTQLRHIILENNDNRPVTFSRDTQEIGLKQGIEMLNIFKSYLAKNSILDDFDFYEHREKLLKAKVSNKKASSQTDMYNNHNFPNRLETREGIVEEAARPKSSDPTPSLINLTKNLSLNSHPLKSGAVKNPRVNSVPSTSGSKAI